MRALCVYCAAPADYWDHVRPLSWGGSNDPANLVPACRRCNLAKKDQPAEVFRLTQPERVAWLESKGWAKRKGAWVDPDTGKWHQWRWAVRKAAWGSDAEPGYRHERIHFGRIA